MRATLIEGDIIFVNKLAYGPRIPITPLSLPIGKKFVDWIQLPYVRLLGYSSIERNDVIVFNYPMEYEFPIDERKEYIKRCIGLPGDTIKIKDGVLSINSITSGESFEPLYKYHVQIANTSNIHSLKKYDSDIDFAEGNEFDLYISSKAAVNLKRDTNISLIVKSVIDSAAYSPTLFPNNSHIKWNADNFGPLYIPKKGDSIILSSHNIILYKRVIEKYEKNVIKVKSDSVFINGLYREAYTFKMNYYFTMGDNRYNSIDSRFYGFVPEDHIMGKASIKLRTETNPESSKKSRSISTIQ